ncbi:MAG: hypothetical protein FWE02_03895 [Defluviitaleaceae bacterium]|nr:hypothetical protein [Defluviitaleaceae bacterium]
MLFQIDFNAPRIDITSKWDNDVSGDSFIIGNTNATRADIKLYNGTKLLFEKTIELPYYINIISIENEIGMLKKINITDFVLTLSGFENISLGYLFFGEAYTLPRFIVNPTKALGLRNNADRTFSGQVTGIPVETLDSFAVSFARINNQEKKIVDKYIQGVQTVIPHVIDPYHEAHEEFEPFFATVAEYSEAEKRAENGFFWNFSIAWQEAK